MPTQSTDYPRLQLDYGKTAIWLYATSEIERDYRSHSCEKQPWTVSWLERFVCEGDVVYDIGANVGAFTLVAAVARGAFVVAFEPGYANYSRLCENVALNNCANAVLPVPLPLAETSGLVRFVYRTVEPGQSRHRLGSRRWKQAGRASAADPTGHIDQGMCTIRLDEARAQFTLPSPTHLKVSVDGAELRVLRGAAATLPLETLRSILVEVNSGDRNEIDALLTTAGFMLDSETASDQGTVHAVFVRAASPGAEESRPAGVMVSKEQRQRHQLLEQRVLEAVLPLRARLLPGRSASADARDREQRFRAASPSYVAALQRADGPTTHARAMRLDGLNWWVPVLQPGNEDATSRQVEHQDFPYALIAQTRELAIGGIMLDIGANNGRMAVPRAILGDVSAVYCAEPDPINYECLVRNVRDNHLSGLVMPDNLAISDTGGVASLERGKTPGGHLLLEPTEPSKRPTIDVPVATLDLWTERLGVDHSRVMFVKIDVQGSELRVLRGAARLLASRHVAWQMEVDPLLLGRHGANAADLYEELQRHFGYFIDLNRGVGGQRVRAIRELAEALGYLGPRARTDVLVFNGDPAAFSRAR